jgi:hypothetical protein
MTTPNTTRRVPADQLIKQIADLLAVAPRSALKLVDMTGYSIYTVNQRLQELKKDGYAYHVPAHKNGTPFTWHIGTAPYVAPKKVDPDVRQKLTRDYPAIGRRDALVAALFGPAKPAGQLQGAGSVLGGEG